MKEQTDTDLLRMVLKGTADIAGVFFSAARLFVLRKASERQVDDRMLVLARHRYGKVTPQAAAPELSLSTPQARASLERLRQDGCCRQVEEGYVFDAFLPQEQVCVYCDARFPDFARAACERCGALLIRRPVEE